MVTSAPGYVVILSRLQFAITTLFHILWPVLTIGLSLFLVVTECLWLRTGDIDWYHHSRFWGRLFLLNFSVDAVTGLPLEFEFGTNWATFSKVGGEFFGNILGFEGAMAFMLEAGFLGIMVFGWNRVPRGVHLIATVMVALGASMSPSGSWSPIPGCRPRSAAIWRTAASSSTAISTQSSTPTCRGPSHTCGSPVSKPVSW